MKEDYSNNDNIFTEERINTNINGNLNNNNNVNNEYLIKIYNSNDFKKEVIINKVIIVLVPPFIQICVEIIPIMKLI